MVDVVEQTNTGKLAAEMREKWRRKRRRRLAAKEGKKKPDS
jgi:hypothetical protein